MSDKEERAIDYVEDILRAADRIRLYTEGLNEEGFSLSQLVQDAVMLNIGIIGEAASRMMRQCPRFVAQHPDIPLRDAYIMRNRLVHGYDTVIVQTVWEAVQRDVPALAGQLRAVVETLRLQHL